jgi:hypothetical protein
LSSLFEVPASLALVLALAASGGGTAHLEATIGDQMSAPSLAEGPCRFSEQMWLRAVAEGAGGEELAVHGARVFKTSSGRYYIPQEEERRQILALRRDAAIAQYVAYRLARRNAEILQAAIGRAPGAGDLYIAHLFGAETAIGLITLAKEKPGVTLASSLPDLVSLAPELAQGRGRAATVSATYARVTQAFANAPQEPDDESLAWGSRLKTRDQDGNLARLDWTTEVRAGP